MVISFDGAQPGVIERLSKTGKLFFFREVDECDALRAASTLGWNLGSQACEFAKANLGTATANRVFFSTFSLGQVFVNVLVCDSIADGQERYDTAFFDLDKDLGNASLRA